VSLCPNAMVCSLRGTQEIIAERRRRVMSRPVFLVDLSAHLFLSGPLGREPEIGAGIVGGGIDSSEFFWDSLQPRIGGPYATIRLAVLRGPVTSAAFAVDWRAHQSPRMPER
jgi:hypothetical protein